MPAVHDLKPRFQSLLRPLVGACVRRGIRPFHLTLTALLGSIAVGAAIPHAMWHPMLLLILPAWLFVRMALNLMVGMAARDHSLASPFGAILNELGDVLSDVALYGPLALLSPALLWPAIAFVIGAVLTEFAGMLGPALGASRRYEGPMGSSERALLVGSLALLTAFVPYLITWWPVILGAGAALTVSTAVNRLRVALREVRRVVP